jgi:hypothetical protein
VCSYAKGVLHLVLSLLTLVPLFFALRALIYYFMLGMTHGHENDSVLQAVVGDLCFGFIKGLGLFLQGALQVVATPLLIFRIPIRLAIPAKKAQPVSTFGCSPTTFRKDGKMSYWDPKDHRRVSCDSTDTPKNPADRSSPVFAPTPSANSGADNLSSFVKHQTLH